MHIIDLKDLKEIVAGDNCYLKEILRPETANGELRYSFAYAYVKPGETTYVHRMKTSEVYYILEGIGEMTIDDETVGVSAGQTIRIPPNSKQFIRNVGSGDLKFLCIVDPAWRLEDEIVV